MKRRSRPGSIRSCVTARRRGAEGILFTGFVLRRGRQTARATIAVPVLTSFEGVIDRALDLEQPLHVVATTADSVTLLRAELERGASDRSRSVSGVGAGSGRGHGGVDQRRPRPSRGVRAVFDGGRPRPERGREGQRPSIGPARESVARLATVAREGWYAYRSRESRQSGIVSRRGRGVMEKRVRVCPAVVFALCGMAWLGASEGAAQEAENWPAFRGPDALSDGRRRRASARTPGAPRRTSCGGRQSTVSAGPSPVIWGDRIFLTTVVSDGETQEPRMGLYFPFGSPATAPELGFPAPGPGDLMEREEDIHHWLVYALDFDSGEVVWTSEVNAEAPLFDRHLKNTYASSTPVTDGERVYAYFGNVGVFALDMDGGLVWEHRFEPEATRLGWGPAASPVLHGGTLFIRQ